MKVWIVNPFDNLPVEGFRPERYWLMARAFARAGHDVTLWTSDFSHALKRPRVIRHVAVTRDENGLESERVTGDGFDLRFVATPPYASNVCLARILSHRAYAKRWYAAALAACAERRADRAPGPMCSRPDVVIVSSPPLLQVRAARRLCRKAGAFLVVDVMDAWPETFERLAPKFAFLLAPLRALARANYRGADVLTAVAARYLELVRAYGATAPTHLCHHGIELPADAPAPRAPHAGLRLVYAGNMGASYDLETVIDGVKAATDVTLELAGTGPKEAALRARAAGCNRIRFHGYLDAEALRALLARADAGVVPMWPDSCVGVPYKLADYAAAGLRIVNSLTGETAELVKKHRAGVCYQAGNLVSFRDVLEELRRAPAAEADVAGLASSFDAVRLYGVYVDFIVEKAEQKGR